MAEAQAIANQAAPFRTDHESGCVPGFDDDRPAAALTINPDASPLALAGAALSRADTLRRSLMAWSCIGGSGSVDVSEVAQALEPSAHEVLLLLDALVTRLSRSLVAQEARHG